MFTRDQKAAYAAHSFMWPVFITVILAFLWLWLEYMNEWVFQQGWSDWTELFMSCLPLVPAGFVAGFVYMLLVPVANKVEVKTSTILYERERRLEKKDE